MTQKDDNARTIPADQVQGCEAWQMPDLEQAHNTVSAQGRSRKGAGSVRVLPMTASKIEALREQAQQEGFAQGQREGYQAGLQQGQAEVDETLAGLNRLMGQLMHPLAEQQQEFELALLNLSMHIARGVVKNSFEYDEQTLLAVVNQALGQLPESSEHIRILAHPHDIELIRRAAEQQAEGWQLIPDATISSGGCVVKTEHSYVDYTLERQFQLTVEEMVKNKNAAGPLAAEPGSAAEPQDGIEP